ncbi:LOW QUALITY PROTEIN: hypothetical protein Cgig2_022652 [Carnegiea gigantea]|uniref:Uncharacterized protein n=1 Tax=Carnegiea gigantea TaxID=171969 RepID=A0A9Q1Q3T9_9CARY|nr:LOW QUALITY PROTEIN: hypothetical protein Cgig2_022652 [Carnegiea gigantea]
MEKIREKDPTAYHWLRDNKKLEMWATSKFDTNLKCDDSTNNFVESFNHAIVKFRGLPIRRKSGNSLGIGLSRDLKSQKKWKGKVVPYVHKKLIRIEMESRNYANLGEFEVTKGHTNLTVSCKTGSMIVENNNSLTSFANMLQDYVENCFTVEKNRNLCKTCKQLGYNAATCGGPRDEHGRLLEKRKRTPTEGRVPRPWGKPKKQKPSASMPAPSTTTITTSILVLPPNAAKLEQFKQPGLEASQAVKVSTILVLVKLYFIVKYL